MSLRTMRHGAAIFAKKASLSVERYSCD